MFRKCLAFAAKGGFEKAPFADLLGKQTSDLTRGVARKTFWIEFCESC